jgi:hypothetical protein
MKPSAITLALSTLLTIAFAQPEPPIVVKLTDASGNSITTGKVAAILKSGAYQDAKFDTVTNEYRCEPTEQCIKIFAGAPGHEAVVEKYPGTGGTAVITMEASPKKNSTIVYRRGQLPGIEGDVNPIYDNLKRTYLYTDKIGLERYGRPAQQPLTFSLKRPIDAVSPIGKPFTIWVVDITQQVSLLEYTLPK